jgi:hypothetical protein
MRAYDQDLPLTAAMGDDLNGAMRFLGSGFFEFDGHPRDVGVC